MCRFRFCDIGGEGVAEIQRGTANGEGALGSPAGLRTLTHDAAIFEREAVRVLEIDRLRPLVIDDLGDDDTHGPQFVALARQTGRRTGLEGEVVEAGRDAEAAIDAGVVLGRNTRYPARLQKGEYALARNIYKTILQSGERTASDVWNALSKLAMTGSRAAERK